MCSIRSHRYCILINLLNKLNEMYEAIRRDKYRSLDLYDEMSGNYSGTEMALSVTEIEEKDEIVQATNEAVQRPAPEVEEIVHARWVYDGNDWYCSNCNGEILEKVEFSRGCYMGCETVHSKRCPHCGAHMENWGDNV